MGKNNNLEKKSVTLNSYTNISYNNLPNGDIFNNGSELENILKDEALSNYEEINDYSFLNVITEEITSLDSVKGADNIKEILKNSLVDIGSNRLHNNIVSDNNFTNLIQHFDNNEYKAFLHSVDNISYLEFIDQNDDSYSVQLQHDGYYNLDTAVLDNILINVIENNSNKG